MPSLTTHDRGLLAGLVALVATASGAVALTAGAPVARAPATPAAAPVAATAVVTGVPDGRGDGLFIDGDSGRGRRGR